MHRHSEPLPDSLEDRWLLEEQTQRNVAGLEAEQDGRLADAVALYEFNAAEGFPGDWPYGRLVAIYEKRKLLDDAVRVLERGIEVFQQSTKRTAQDRRTMVQTFRRRLALVKRQRKAQTRLDGRRTPG